MRAPAPEIAGGDVAMIRAILTDIEGTTSSLSFVKDVLFPYSRSRMGEFVRAHASDPAVRRLLDDARTAAPETPSGDDALIAVLVRWIDEDRKATPLKALQGLIWEAGYRNGDFKGHLYADAYAALRTWHERDLRLYVFSSGSVKAQQLLFAHSDYGDLTPLFNGYFDTTIGAKRESDAYRRIAREIGLPAADILFLSDIKEELDAAHGAGMKTYWVVRAGEPIGRAAHPIARSLADIAI
jgi:enolase-phosphatase E1